MSKWKLVRQTFGTEEFQIQEGEEVTVGRGVDNKIVLTSIVISRKHCVINVQKENVLITDLKSSNGIYVGSKKIPQEKPYILKNCDVIGFGWTIGAPYANVKDDEKYIFKLVRDEPFPTLTTKIKFQSENDFELEVIDKKLEVLTKDAAQSPIIETKSLKRKIEDVKPVIKTEFPKSKCPIFTIDDEIIDVSDSDNEIIKKAKLDDNVEQIKLEIKTEREDIEYEAFKVKQEYLAYDEPIILDSDDDSDDDHWKLRLSPGKTLKKREVNLEESSYSQLDDFFDDNEDLANDLIFVPPPQPDNGNQAVEEKKDEAPSPNEDIDKMQVDEDDDDLYSNMISIAPPDTEIKETPRVEKPVELSSVVDRHEIPLEEKGKDAVDGTSSGLRSKEKLSAEILEATKDKVKKALMIPIPVISPKRKSHTSESRRKSTSSSKHAKDKKHSSSKKNISDSQKEERRKRLKDLTTKDTHIGDSKTEKNVNAKKSVNAKVTNSNRGAFLIDTVANVVKPTNKKESPKKSSTSKETKKSKESSKTTEKKQVDDIENNKQKRDVSKTRERKSIQAKDKSAPSKPANNSEPQKPTLGRIPLKALKPLSGSEEKPVSTVAPFSATTTKKKKKSVRFSDKPEVREFEIEEGHRMKKTSLVKTSLLDKRHTSVFSLEKDTLMKILRWNPQWLEEQINNTEPPPILGHNRTPMTILHNFVNHSQYVQVIGDLLLMEIWESLTQEYMKTKNSKNLLEFRIESMPAPSQASIYELFNLAVKVTVPNNELNTVPRMGEIMNIAFGPDKIKRFFYVHNVRNHPRLSNSHSTFSVHLHACYTEKMSPLRIDDVMVGKSLAYINKELTLFDALEYLAGSPLNEAILRPDPRHFIHPKEESSFINTQWTNTLNVSQKVAITASVNAALGDRPSIQMVQGPPGTGKSSVICAIVMSYFYDSLGKKQTNRGKILICATSNAAVDELVIRLLNIRQELPKGERFRMVRVGRAEAMHPRAKEVSSQQLAQRDSARQPDPALPHYHEEISLLVSKINMWESQAQATNDPTRAAYCKSRIKLLKDRINMVKNGGGGYTSSGEDRSQQIAQTEKRIIEGADIILTTLSSAHNFKMKVLKRRIALCIIDEAGQAIEPEALIPLTLDVTKLTLIGDPQQLPGYICSQRAKKYGLGASLFSRLASVCESGPVLLRCQYRMHPDIADYPNRAFYGGLVSSAPPLAPNLPLQPYTILSVASGDKGQGACGGNEMEAWGVSRLVAALYSVLHNQGLSLAVITPYNGHKELIKKNLRALMAVNEPPIEVNTVDSFQGQERDVVVVSLARSKGVGFLTDLGRMNVMLTRARHALLVCLNPIALIDNPQWETLVQDARSRNMLKCLPLRLCKPPSIQISHEDVLQIVKEH